MDEEKSELSRKDVVISENFDQTDSSEKSNILLTEVPDFLVHCRPDLPISWSLCTKEEKTLSSTDLCTSEHETKLPELKTPEIQNVVEAVGNIVPNSNLDTKLATNNGEIKVPTNMTECKEIYNYEEQKSSCSMRHSSQSNTVVRPSLIDDSKLVKISLPTNPISIMQSNTQFLNKSRNFLNFITEKSTNIMEKALLPQHLTVKYNSVMRSIDNTCSEKKCAEGSCTAKSSSTELSFGNDPKLVEKTKDTSQLLRSSMGTQNEKNECTVNCEDQSTSILKSDESTCINVEENHKDNGSLCDLKLIDMKQIESHTSNDRVDKINDNVPCTEVSDNYNENMNSMVLNSEDKDSVCSNENTVDGQHQTQEQVIEPESSQQSLLNHPAYLTLLKDYADLKAKYLKCQKEVENLEEENKTLEVESKKDIQSVQIENLEKTINRLTSELHATMAAQDMLRKEYSAAKEERDNMVMKYAVSEKQLIDTQRARENAERKAKDSGKQHELLQNFKKEVERLKEDLNMRDVKLKWSQNKLKTEIDLRKETEQKLEKAMTRINELKEECEQVRKEAQESMRKFQQKDEQLTSVEAEIKDLRSTNEELQADMSACRQKEAEMLDFTQKLTDKNVRLQSEFTAIETKVKQLEEEHGPLHKRISDLTGKIKMLEECLAQEQKMRNEECEILAKHLAEQTQVAQNLAQKLEDSQGENAVLKRKQQINMKEMTRELQQCRKKLEVFETSSPYNSLGVASRAGSNMSLNTDALNGALSDNSTNGEQNIQSIEPSRQALIDRLIKLQEDNAKKAEKLDFFEEHSRTLVEELQKKTRIIQTYILHENSGAMGSNERDRYKAELARHGGIMASVYNQRVSDDNMTLELSLEINQKLQAVLEDALFKNITLKDNIDTLGEEIARLTMQNRRREVAN